MSKYTHVEWSPAARDFVPVKPRPRKFWAGLLEPVGNVIATAFIFSGIIVFVFLMHFF